MTELGVLEAIYTALAAGVVLDHVLGTLDRLECGSGW